MVPLFYFRQFADFPPKSPRNIPIAALYEPTTSWQFAELTTSLVIGINNRPPPANNINNGLRIYKCRSDMLSEFVWPFISDGPHK